MRLRPLIALSAVAVAAVLLAGCAGSGSPTATPSGTAKPATDLCKAAAKPGDASKAVKVAGDAGKEPTSVTFTAPLTIKTLQRTVVSEGSGAKLKNGQWVTMALTAFDATSGKKIGSTGYQPGTFLPSQVSAATTLGQVLGCATIGSRIVIALPPQQQQGGAVYVFDVLGTSKTKAWGKAQPATAGMPKVTLAADGTPTITIPDTTPPTALQIAVLKQGDGAVVADGDTVLLQYSGVSWDDKKNFDSSWKRGAPSSFATNQVYEGFGKALVGQKVGSQVLVVMPPSMGDTSGNLKGKTLVFVIDILATQHAPAQ